MGPINYMAGIQQPALDEAILNGLKLGATLREARDKRAAAAQQAEAEVQYKADLQGALSNPTADAFAALAVKYPKHREAYKQAWEGLSTERQQNELRDASELAAALQGGRPDVALSRLDERIATMEASGADTKRLKFLRDQVQTNPQQALGSVLAVVSGVPGGDKLLENLGKLGAEQRAAARAPAELRSAEAAATSAEAAAKVAPTVQQATADKAVADASTAQTTAKYAEPMANADLKKKAAELGLTKAQTSQALAAAQKLSYERQQAVLEAVAGDPGQVAFTRRYGKAPAGYRWKANGELQSIPGGPADIKATAEGQKTELRQRQAVQQAGNVLGIVREAKELVSNTTAGIGGLAASIPMTDARKLAGQIDTIKANLGFDRLQQMRESSPTGGALGAVAVQELMSLQATVAKLDQLQKPADVRDALDKVDLHYTRWLETMAGTATPQPRPAIGTVDAGYRFKGGDPGKASNWEPVK